MDIHVVRPGDTLYGIAVRYQADPAVLQELNGLSPDSVLAVGQTVVIRHVDTFHTVQPGQTLAGIAGLYGVPLGGCTGTTSIWAASPPSSRDGGW